MFLRPQRENILKLLLYQYWFEGFIGLLVRYLFSLVCFDLIKWPWSTRKRKKDKHVYFIQIIFCMDGMVMVCNVV